LALLVGVMVLFPFLAIVIIPFIVISILIGLGIRSIGGSMTEPVRSEVRDSAERIAEAIESLRSDHGHPDTEGDDEDEDEVENDPPVTKELMEEIKSFLKENDRGR
jgi:type II secretory pathway pseudopilin PulG